MSEFYIFSWIADLFHTHLVKATIFPMFILPILENEIPLLVSLISFIKSYIFSASYFHLPA